MANFERLEPRGRKTTVRLLNVRRSTGERIAARGWFAYAEAFGWLGLVEGDVVQFDVRVEPTRLGKRTLRLTNPANFKKLPFDLWRGLCPGGPPGEVQPGQSGRERLTGRERQVLELLMDGHDNGEIARQLGLSTRTVSNYVSAVYGKLNVSSRAELADWVGDYGLRPPT